MKPEIIKELRRDPDHTAICPLDDDAIKEPDSRLDANCCKRVLTVDRLELEKFLAFDRLKTRLMLDATRDMIRREDISSCTCSIFDPIQETQPIVYVASNYERITGFPETAAVGSTCHFLRPRSRELDEAVNGFENRRIEALCKHAIQKESPAVTALLLSERRDGQFFWNLLRVSFELVEGRNYAVALYSLVQARIPDLFPNGVSGEEEAKSMAGILPYGWFSQLNAVRDALVAAQPASFGKLTRLVASRLNTLAVPPVSAAAAQGVSAAQPPASSVAALIGGVGNLTARLLDGFSFLKLVKDSEPTTPAENDDDPVGLEDLQFTLDDSTGARRDRHAFRGSGAAKRTSTLSARIDQFRLDRRAAVENSGQLSPCTVQIQDNMLVSDAAVGIDL